MDYSKEGEKIKRQRTLFLVEVAIFAAFALLSDIIPFLSFKIWA
nr:hypothetical protein [Virgibacillus proomii]